MRTILISSFVFSVCFAAAVNFDIRPLSNSVENTPSITKLEVEAAEEFVRDTKPVRLLIPSIGLDAAIVSVGADPDGRMSVPTDNKSVSWWIYGARPGETGSAVLAGHFTQDSGNGVFFNLPMVEIGDIVEVLDDNNSKVSFVVDRIVEYEEALFPVGEVYSRKDGQYLNLITCSGKYIASIKDYTHRMVIYTKKQL